MELVAGRLKADDKKRFVSEPHIIETDKEDADVGIGAGYGELSKDDFDEDYFLEKISMLQLRLDEAQKTLQAERDDKHELHKSIEKLALELQDGVDANRTAAPNYEVSPTKIDKCPLLNGSGIAGVAATATGTVVGAITTPAPTTTTVVKGDARKSSAHNSINEDGHTQSNDVSIIEDDLSDLDLEITNVEEDEDNRPNADELQKKLDKIVRALLGSVLSTLLEAAQGGWHLH
ncbi:GH13916 [Drosophila grimshawi]|uniref:GH13916 n=1 Tax=Drosophila grimshawi TaxID=7222 RepID=B4K0V6_DROGR|nr:GH13916 [Drosophila grimshawi]